MTMAQLRKNAPKRCLRCNGRVRLEDVRRMGEHTVAATLFCRDAACAAEADVFFNAATGRVQ